MPFIKRFSIITIHSHKLLYYIHSCKCFDLGPLNICKMSNSDGNIDQFFNTALQLTKEAGNLIKEKIKIRDKKTEVKSGQVDLVTETDKAVEKLLIDGLTKAFADHKFIGEESVAAGGNIKLTECPTWVIDPIDGTMNFVHSFPHSCVSIALFIDKIPVIGIIYNPMLNQLFTAKKGQGAFYNGEKIQVSNQKGLKNALLMMECGTSREKERVEAVCENQRKLMPLVHGIRSLGSAALNMAMVAMGAADAYFEFGIHIWDFGAGELIVKEAGGVVMDPAGGDLDRMSRRMLCASSCELAKAIVKEIVQLYPKPDNA